ncbi:MAG: DNA-3-methyladenine glycosylase [Candidatus Nealsonbacteria bacterium]|nr:DNA-3-methyladenine glycosylase [Candidatus Nealsonbacteria bacterium]
MKKRISKNFYIRPTLKVAKDLLGKNLIRKIGKEKLIGKIVETEAYIGPKDKASHAYCWKMTERNKVEYLEGGRIYIYLCYGMHWQLNFTTQKQGKPECVLIRALEPILKYKNLKEIKNLTTGPGKLCRWLKLDKSFYGEDLIKSKRIWLEGGGEKMKKSQIMAARRIGIDYAGSWAKKPWRFYIKNNPFVSTLR